MSNILHDIARVARQIIIRQPYYGIFLSTLNRKIDNSEQCPTAGVSKNGLNTQLSVNEAFWAKMKEHPKQKIGIMIHELLHICFFHITQAQSYKDKELFNIAADIEINQYIFELKDVELPKGALTLEFGGFDPKKDAKKGTRFYYEKMRKKLNNKGSGSDSGSGGGIPQGLQDLYDSLKQGNQEVCSHGTWKDFKDLSESEQRVIEDQIKTQMKNSYESVDKTRGTIPNALREMLEELVKPKKSLFNWRAAVRRFTGGHSQETYTKKLRRKFNKRFEDLPGLKIKNKKKLMCAVDTSGSVSHEEFIEFMREIDCIRKTGVGVTVVECDAYVDEDLGVYEFKGLKNLKDRAVTGGGGTSFDPPMEYFNKHMKEFCAMIYLTDGYAPTPKIKIRKPLMWVMSQSGKTPNTAKNDGFPGYIIKIPKEEEFA